MAKGDDIENRLIDFLDALLDECDQLCRIIRASIQTARQARPD